MPQICIREMNVMEKLLDANKKMDMLHVFGGVRECAYIFKQNVSLQLRTPRVNHARGNAEVARPHLLDLKVTGNFF